MPNTFFREFPDVDYTLDGIKHRITNINTAYTLITNKLSDTFLFQKYIVADGDSPESIADKVYGNYSYYWVILIVNNIVNPFLDWVKWGQSFNNWMVQKYSDTVDGIYGVHHFYNTIENRIADDYEDKQYRILGPGNYPAEIRPITNQEYEIDQNNNLRQINLIDPKYIKDFVNEFSRMMNKRVI